MRAQPVWTALLRSESSCFSVSHPSADHNVNFVKWLHFVSSQWKNVGTKSDSDEESVMIFSLRICVASCRIVSSAFFDNSTLQNRNFNRPMCPFTKTNLTQCLSSVSTDNFKIAKRELKVFTGPSSPWRFIIKRSSFEKWNLISSLLSPGKVKSSISKSGNIRLIWSSSRSVILTPFFAISNKPQTSSAFESSKLRLINCGFMEIIDSKCWLPNGWTLSLLGPFLMYKCRRAGKHCSIYVPAAALLTFAPSKFKWMTFGNKLLKFSITLVETFPEMQTDCTFSNALPINENATRLALMSVIDSSDFVHPFATFDSIQWLYRRKSLFLL